MSRVTTTLTIDQEVLRAVRIKAARTGRADSEIIEDAVRRYLKLDSLERIWAKADLDPDEAMDLALEAQHETRHTHRANRSSSRARRSPGRPGAAHASS